MPPDDADPETFAPPAAEGSMLYAFTRPILSGWLKLVIDADCRRVRARIMWGTAPRTPSSTSTT